LQIVLICFFLLLSIVLLLNIQLEIRLNIGDNNTKSYFTIKALKGLFSFRYNLFANTPDNQMDTEGNKIKKRGSHRRSFNKIGKYVKLLKRYSHGIKKSLFYILKKIIIKKIDIDSLIGTGDPMSTAILTGFINIFLVNGLTHLHRFSSINTHSIIIKPEFTKTIFKVKFHCIIQIKLGYIIIAAFIVAKQIIIRW
jgi:hypothetical protein